MRPFVYEIGTKFIDSPPVHSMTAFVSYNDMLLAYCQFQECPLTSLPCLFLLPLQISAAEIGSTLSSVPSGLHPSIPLRVRYRFLLSSPSSETLHPRRIPVVQPFPFRVLWPLLTSDDSVLHLCKSYCCGKFIPLVGNVSSDLPR